MKRTANNHEPAPAARKSSAGTRRRREAVSGLLFAAPAILGFLIFFLIPMAASLGISFTDWSLLSDPHWIGLDNYREMLRDANIPKSLRITGTYSLYAVPLGLIVSLAIAVLLNQKVKGQQLFLLMFYLPSILPIVAVVVVWLWLLDPNFGLVNTMLQSIGLPTPGWFSNPDLVIPSFVLMSLWGAGGTSVIFLASLQGIPTELYDAAKVDGAGSWPCFRHITLPMISPVIFFNLVIGLIGALQTFTQGYLVGGGRNDAALFYNLYLYNNAFVLGKMGYASAMAWVLFLITIVLTLFVFRTSAFWVFYQGMRKR